MENEILQQILVELISLKDGQARMEQRMEGFEQRMGGMEQRMGNLEEDMTVLRDAVTFLEVDHGQKLGLLLDGQQANTEAINRLAAKVRQA